jgi:hypothetical protein
MKVKELIIDNIGIIKYEKIKLDQPLILFFGQIRQGKTTILNAVKLLFGGSVPADVIRHGQKEAHVELIFENGSIRREFYLSKDGEQKAREIQFIRDGQLVKSPAKEIKKLLNPYLLDSEFLKKMTGSERNRYFIELFAIDTSDLDQKISQMENEARELRAVIKGFGEIDLTLVESIDVTVIRAELARIKEQHEVDCGAIRSRNKEIDARNLERQAAQRHINQLESDIRETERQIEKLTADLERYKKSFTTDSKWLEDNPILYELDFPEAPDTSALEQQISEAAAQQVRVEQYEKNVKRAEQKEEQSKKLAEGESHIRELRKRKISRLKNVASKIQIKGLEFNEDGSFSYENTSSDMLSTSQIMQLSQELSGLYSSEFGIELIDRAESLGKAIFDFIDYAEKQERTILAAIVGDEPATHPDNVGIFVVEDGKIKK